MFGIPGKQAVSITDKAAIQIAKLMAKDATLDEVVEQDGARVMIAPMAQMFLFGTEIDYEVSLLESGFKFRNPNVTEACGCGESIKFDDSLVPNS